MYKFTKQVPPLHALRTENQMKIKWSQRMWCNFCYYHFSSGELMCLLIVFLPERPDAAATTHLCNAIFRVTGKELETQGEKSVFT